MLDRELNRKTLGAVGAVMLMVAGAGFAGYRSYNQKQVDQIVARRELQMDRERGIPASLEADPNASPEERKQARVAAIEKMQFKGTSPVEVDPKATPEPTAAATPTATPIPSATPAPAAVTSTAPVPSVTPVPNVTPVPGLTPIPAGMPVPSGTPLPSPASGSGAIPAPGTPG